MAKQTWLMQALNEASKQAQELPRWARDVNSAVDDFYNRSASLPALRGATADKGIERQTEASLR